MPGDAGAVPGHADEADQPLVARLDRRLDRAPGPWAWSHSSWIDEVVELDQIDVIDAQPLQRAFQLRRAAVRALAGLGGEEEVVPVSRSQARAAARSRRNWRPCRCG